MGHNYDRLILLFGEIFGYPPARAKAESIRAREARFYSALQNCIEDALARRSTLGSQSLSTREAIHHFNVSYRERRVSYQQAATSGA